MNDRALLSSRVAAINEKSSPTLSIVRQEATPENRAAAQQVDSCGCAEQQTVNASTDGENTLVASDSALVSDFCCEQHVPQHAEECPSSQLDSSRPDGVARVGEGRHSLTDDQRWAAINRAGAAFEAAFVKFQKTKQPADLERASYHLEQMRQLAMGLPQGRAQP